MLLDDCFGPSQPPASPASSQLMHVFGTGKSTSIGSAKQGLGTEENQEHLGPAVGLKEHMTTPPSLTNTSSQGGQLEC